jgi:hypothetical protein
VLVLERLAEALPGRLKGVPVAAGVEVGVSLAALALYRLAMTFIKQREAAQQTALLERRVQVLRDLIHEDKLPVKQAEAIVKSLLEGMKGNEDDPLFKATLGLLAKGQK